MPIIHLGTLADRNKPDFFVQVKAGNDSPEYINGQYVETGMRQGPFIEYCTYQSHHGLCLRDFERNGYHDSDWFMVVWNPEKRETETIEFASTRGWSYPCYGSKPDASEETLAAYRQYEDARERLAAIAATKQAIAKLCAIRNAAKVIALAANVPVGKVLKLRHVIGADKLESIAKLYSAGIRSGFKISMRNQVVAWLKENNPKYATPLSRKQLECL